MTTLQDLLAALADLLLLPVFCGLLLALAYALLSAGSLLRERFEQRTTTTGRYTRLAALAAQSLPAARDELALLEAQHAAIVDRGALVSRLAPMFGLAGTLIPLGPGLRELHAGNVGGLGEQLAVAFSTTVAGLAACAICYAIASTRSRWYEAELRTLETLLAEIGRG